MTLLISILIGTKRYGLFKFFKTGFRKIKMFLKPLGHDVIALCHIKKSFLDIKHQSTKETKEYYLKYLHFKFL
jgi:hypothetical protein